MNKLEQNKAHMARTLSKAYGWSFEELMAMKYDELDATYSERYLDYIYGV